MAPLSVTSRKFRMHHQHRLQQLAKLAAFLLAAAPIATCQATTSGVPGPGVTAGDRSIEYRASYRPDEGPRPGVFTHRLHYQHALDDSRRLRVIAQHGKTDVSDWELRYTRLEYQWQYRERDDNGRSSGLRFDLQLVEGDDEPHFAGVVWTTEFPLGGATTRLNAFVRKQFGDRAASGVNLATRAEIAVNVDGTKLGLQLFNGYGSSGNVGSFDEQRHQIGPIVSRRFGRWQVFASYLTGLSDSAPDGAFRLFIGTSL